MHQQQELLFGKGYDDMGWLHVQHVNRPLSCSHRTKHFCNRLIYQAFHCNRRQRHFGFDFQSRKHMVVKITQSRPSALTEYHYYVLASIFSDLGTRIFLLHWLNLICQFLECLQNLDLWGKSSHFGTTKWNILASDSRINDLQEMFACSLFLFMQSRNTGIYYLILKLSSR